MRESKFVVLGAGGVGKTSLVIRFLNDAFSSTYKPTVEDCYQHTIQLPDGISHTVEILDTAGSHHFPAMRELSIRSGRGFLIVYSVDSLQSFREAVQLYELIIDIRGAQVPVVLVGNKSDLEIHRQVSHETAAQKASEALSGCPFFEASAKFDINVKEVFLELLQIAREHEEAQEAMLEEQDLFRRKSRSGILVPASDILAPGSKILVPLE
ncbi:ras-related protein Rap-2a-like [Uloborus diversus]|uniref:ras-related protein Rap-2a-like n=1 Tax=Uloborus diversus TaxID=327109 RepID=UPI002408F618|nr:ras-related protein Rap-2a-like [Uloborus diversus]